MLSKAVNELLQRVEPSVTHPEFLLKSILWDYHNCLDLKECYVSTRRLPDLGDGILRISLVRTTSAYFKQRRASKQ